MLRDLPHLAKYMPESRDARRLIPCPEDEPDLAAISRAYPVPGAPFPACSPAGIEEKAEPPKSAAAIPQATQAPTFADWSAQQRSAKVPRVMVQNGLSAAVMPANPAFSLMQPAVDVCQARDELNLRAAAAAQLQLEELQALRRLQAAAQLDPVMAYAQLLRNGTLPHPR